MSNFHENEYNWKQRDYQKMYKSIVSLCYLVSRSIIKVLLDIEKCTCFSKYIISPSTTLDNLLIPICVKNVL
jgi:hypothetical protein